MKKLDKLKEIRKEFFDKDILNITIFTLTFISASSFSFTKNQDDVLKLSKSIYNTFDTKSDDIIYPKFEGKKCKIDLSMTKANLKSINELKIDLLKTNINDLLSFENLEELKIQNYKYISQEDKNVLKKIVNLKKLTILIDEDNIAIDDLDFSYLNDKVDIIIEPAFEQKNDVFDLLTYLMSIKANNNVSTTYTKEELEKYSLWHDEIKDIVDSFKFDKNTTEEEKVYTIFKYVIDNIDYNHLTTKDNAITPLLYDSFTLAKYYNDNMLGSYLTDNDEKGVCCNYAALATILGYYSDVDINYVKGWYGVSHEGHAWCNYKDLLIDPTYLDHDSVYPKSFDDLKILDDSLYYEDVTTNLYDSNKEYNKKISYINEAAIDYNKMKDMSTKEAIAIIAGLFTAFIINNTRNDSKVKEKKR